MSDLCGRMDLISNKQHTKNWDMKVNVNIHPIRLCSRLNRSINVNIEGSSNEIEWKIACLITIYLTRIAFVFS